MEIRLTIRPGRAAAIQSESGFRRGEKSNIERERRGERCLQRPFDRKRTGAHLVTHADVSSALPAKGRGRRSFTREGEREWTADVCKKVHTWK